MISKKLHQKIRSYVQFLQRYVNRYWYPPLLGLLAALDNFIVVVPTDGMLISSSMIIPKRWTILALNIAIGSSLGAILLAALVEYQGLPWILEFYPGIDETKAWTLTLSFFAQYGLLLVFAIAATPLMQQPAVIIAALANTPLPQLAAVIFTGRLIKFLVISYIGSHTPSLLNKLWGFKGELDDVGVKLK